MSFEQAVSKLSIPERKLTTLSFCEPVPKQLQQWVESLPMVNLGEASKQLYHAITELNQLIIDADVKLKLIEIIRPSILSICRSLSKHYLNKPVFLPKQALTVSHLASVLDSQLAAAYKIIIVDVATSSTPISRKNKKILLIALERAIDSLSNYLLRTYQLYSSPIKNVWYELHQLYLIADTNQLLDIAILDKENHSINKVTIALIYKRMLMFGCCGANQLRQANIQQIYDAMGCWAQHINLEKVPTDSEFIVGIDDDTPPINAHLNQNKQLCLYGINFSQLLTHLNDYITQIKLQDGVPYKGLAIPNTIDIDILRHLVNSWSSLTDRIHNRVLSNNSTELCVGFGAAHYYASGSVDFSSQLQQDLDTTKVDEPQQSTNKFVGRDVKTILDYNDVWAKNLDAIDKGFENRSVGTLGDINMPIKAVPNKPSPPVVNSSNYSTYHAQLVNISPTGYCVRWQKDMPKEVKTGEIIGAKEEASNIWRIGIIRWISQISLKESLLGIELLAPGLIPCGAKVIINQQKKLDYMRVFLVPAIASIKQVTSLIAPNIPFQQGVQIALNQYGELTYGQLIECTAALGNFSQLIFRADKLNSSEIDDLSDDSEDFWPDI